MKRVKFISIFIFVLSSTFVCTLLPYPILSKYTNVNSTHMSQINNYFESEITNNSTEKQTILNLNWFKDIDSLLCCNKKYEVIDLNTKTIFNIVRIGGKNHADVIVYNQNDEIYKQEWRCHPVLVKLNENAYLPAAFISYKHGYNSHYCLHFNGSKTDGTNTADENAQKCVKYAQKHGLKLLENI